MPFIKCARHTSPDSVWLLSAKYESKYQSTEVGCMMSVPCKDVVYLSTFINPKPLKKSRLASSKCSTRDTCGTGYRQLACPHHVTVPWISQNPQEKNTTQCSQITNSEFCKSSQKGQNRQCGQKPQKFLTYLNNFECFLLKLIKLSWEYVTLNPNA